MRSKNESLRSDIANVLNRHNTESGSNTPDFILADFLVDCLSAFDKALKRRDAWYMPTDCQKVGRKQK